MNCINCQSKLNGHEKYCPNCGHEVKNDLLNQVDKSIEKKRSISIVLGIISLVGIFFLVFSPISLVLSIIGLILAIKANKEVRNIAGIVLNAVSILISLLIIGFMALIIWLSIGIIRTGGVDITNAISDYTQKFNNYGQKF